MAHTVTHGHTQSQASHTDLVEGLLEVRGAHAVGQMPVPGMGHEELALSRHGGVNVLLPIDVLLASVHHPDVPWTQTGPTGVNTTVTRWKCQCASLLICPVTPN